MIVQKLQWSEQAAHGLRDTMFTDGDFDGRAYIENGVKDGSLELWLIDGHSYAVTQTWKGKMLLWCYQGKNLREFVEVFYKIACNNKLTDLQFATKHRGIPRMLKHLKPTLVEGTTDLYRIGAVNHV